MRTANRAVVVDNMTADPPKACPHLLPTVRSSMRNAEVTSVVRKMIADDRSVLPRTVDDFHERGRRLRLGCARMVCDPVVHLGNVRGWTDRYGGTETCWC